MLFANYGKRRVTVDSISCVVYYKIGKDSDGDQALFCYVKNIYGFKQRIGYACIRNARYYGENAHNILKPNFIKDPTYINKWIDDFGKKYLKQYVADLTYETNVNQLMNTKELNFKIAIPLAIVVLVGLYLFLK